jgi:hypothetical protein
LLGRGAFFVRPDRTTVGTLVSARSVE